MANLILTKLGHRVDLAASGLEAVTAVQQILYDVVFMDCQMPELDGYAATERIRQLVGPRARVPIVASRLRMVRASSASSPRSSSGTSRRESKRFDTVSWPPIGVRSPNGRTA